MKGCIICMAPRQLQLEIFDAKILSQIRDYTKILVADQVLSDSLNEADHQCYDEIFFVNTEPEGPYGRRFNKQELLNVIKPLAEKYSPKNVTLFVADEFNVETIADVTSTLGANGYHHEKVDFFRDKALMKSYLHQNSKVNVPKHILLNPLPNYQDLVDLLGSPFVAKPVAEAGATGVEFIHSEEEWEALRKKRNDDFSNYEAETFLSGQLFHVDSVRVRGKIVAFVICEYLHPVGDFISGSPVASILIHKEHPAYASIEKLNKEVLDTFGEDGCFHLECFYEEEKEPIFLEIAWRQAGKPCCSNFNQVYNGYSQTLFYVFTYLDYPFPEPNFSDYKRIDFLLPKRKGVFNGLVFPKLRSEIVDEVLMIKKGEEVMEDPKIFNDISASFSMVNSNYDQFYQDFLTLRNAKFYR